MKSERKTYRGIVRGLIILSIFNFQLYLAPRRKIRGRLGRSIRRKSNIIFFLIAMRPMKKVSKPYGMPIRMITARCCISTRYPTIKQLRRRVLRWIRPSRNAASVSSCILSKRNPNVTRKRRTIPNISYGSNPRSSMPRCIWHGFDSVRQSSIKAIS